MTYETASRDTRQITAFFDRKQDADEAVERLIASGISRSNIRLVPGQGSGQATGTYSSSNEGGVWDALQDLFMPEEDRYTYAEGLRRGGYLVSVTVSDANYETALDILDDEGTVDINERETAWRSEGWS